MLKPKNRDSIRPRTRKTLRVSAPISAIVVGSDIEGLMGQTPGPMVELKVMQREPLRPLAGPGLRFRVLRMAASAHASPGSHR